MADYTGMQKKISKRVKIMKMYKYKFGAVLLCFVTVLALLTATVSAEVPIESKRKCSLRIVFTPEDIMASGVKFSAYKTASVTASYEFLVEPKFAGQDITKLLVNPDAESYSLIASTLSGVISSDSTIKPDGTAVSDSFGEAYFENLEIGLYLIIGEVHNGENAYYTPQSFMVSFPERQSNNLWNYDIFAEVKWEKRLKNDPVNLEVQKIWSDSATNLHTNDSITVELYKDGTLYDTQALSRNNNWNYKWENLYGGALWTVKEKDVKGYTGTVERKGDCFVVTNSPEKPITPPFNIPQTGLLRWPVPMLTAVGILFVITGVYIKRKGEK